MNKQPISGETEGVALQTVPGFATVSAVLYSVQ